MGLLSFNNKSKDIVTKIELVTVEGNGFFSWNGDLYRSDIIRGLIRTKSKAVGKMVAKHIRDSLNGFEINPMASIRFLLEDPNPLMSGQLLQEKMVTQLELNGNAFAIIIDDEFGIPNQIYPVVAFSVEAVYDEANVLNLKFKLKNGKALTYPYNKIIHLRKDFSDNDIFGTSPSMSLINLMEIVNTTDQGVVKAIQNSNVIKWLLKFKQVLKPEDIKIETKKFIDNYLKIDLGEGGAAAIDPKYDVEQVKPESYVPNAAQMDKTTQRLYNFFNINENIVQSKYSEDEWNAYYESEIEPLGIQLGNEYTRKLFTRKERSFGNKIVFESSNLQCASMSTKLGLVQMVDRGALTPNEWRAVLNLMPIDGGDRTLRRLDTAVLEKEGESIVNRNENEYTNKG
ncbi:TPA: phage portal protein [Clostridioides difficile]|uniref:phage portal protein n=1 Tax=Clostridioides difficile TaxID=1496 RepID=UPI00038C834F|nr:phage portal protein [Clostridioides difficile]EQJ93880.1 phage portal family protein [Clostridioides difficile P51]MDO0459753.1 phage portal protein [Clostridioides difficile]HBF1697474.1 phage portal protein [Clostridioides difficile]HBF3265494.1 phage portal protein [Clostridioides difficile]HBG0928051.1 phage portal protein [Clostridioides difficile]